MRKVFKAGINPGYFSSFFKSFLSRMALQPLSSDKHPCQIDDALAISLISDNLMRLVLRLTRNEISFPVGSPLL